jgi:hypothetical protein
MHVHAALRTSHRSRSSTALDYVLVVLVHDHAAPGTSIAVVLGHLQPRTASLPIWCIKLASSCIVKCRMVRYRYRCKLVHHNSKEAGGGCHRSDLTWRIQLLGAPSTLTDLLSQVQTPNCCFVVLGHMHGHTVLGTSKRLVTCSL